MSGSTKVYNIQLLIDSQLEHVRLLGSAVRGIGTELQLPDDQVGQLELLLVEAVNNVIEHAYEFKAGNDVRVHVECDPGNQIKLVITDQGSSMPDDEVASRAKLPELPAFPEPESLPEGGWGLGLINILADSFHYEKDSKGNHLHLSKLLA